MQKYHDEPKQYKGYLKSALTMSIPTCTHSTTPASVRGMAVL